MTDIARLASGVTNDRWRDETSFSQEIAAVHQVIWNSANRDEITTALSGWIRRYQPCLFGRIAAKEGLLSFCILTEDDMTRGDEHVQERIQSARTEWTREAFEGRKSGFVILLISPRLATAVPDMALSLVAQRLASLYLLTEIQFDAIYLEEVFLEMPSYRNTTWRWAAGVNYFAANADGRWWQDHRIPGGIALSANSVGHMVKSSTIARSQRSLEKELNIPTDGILPTKIDTLDQALEFAMRTIDMASKATSGPATYLLSREAETGAARRCPISLPPNLEGKDCREYEGFYHTDMTLPSMYFRPDIRRPQDTLPIRLDFTYLWDKTHTNPDHVTIGTGRNIRSGSRSKRTDALANRPAELSAGKSTRIEPVEIDIAASQRLRLALGR